MNLGDSQNTLKKIRIIQTTDHISSHFNDFNINHLDNDSLSYIFYLLPTSDKFSFSEVCKRWDSLSEKFFSVLKSELMCFKLNKEFGQKYLSNCINNKERTILLLKIIEKFGRDIRNLAITDELDVNYTDLLKSFSIFCEAIQKLSLKETKKNVFNNENLKDLFSNNESLQSIILEDLNLNAAYFSSIKNTDRINELSVSRCKFDSKNNFYELLKQLHNLKKFHIKDYSVNIVDVIIALLKSKSEDLCELSIESMDLSLATEEIVCLLSRQKKLRKLSFYNNFFHPIHIECIMSKISVENLEEISDTWCYEESLNYLYLFKNLQVLSFIIIDLTDKCIESITKCKTLKTLEINVRPSRGVLKNFTLVGENNFKNLNNIEKFSFRIFNRNIDNILIALTSDNNENLKNVNISECEFTKIGIESLSTLPNLTSLNVSRTLVTNKILIDLIKASKSVNELDVTRCFYVTNEFIETISEIKNNRYDHVLKIYTNKSKINLNNLKIISPMLSLIA